MVDFQAQWAYQKISESIAHAWNVGGLRIYQSQLENCHEFYSHAKLYLKKFREINTTLQFQTYSLL